MTFQAGFHEVADRVWVARYEWFDVNVTLVGGGDGLLVVDTHASALAARSVVEDIRRLGAGEVVRVVNTHEHFDHTFGNGELRAAYGAIPILAHETAAERTPGTRSNASLTCVAHESQVIPSMRRAIAAVTGQAPQRFTVDG